MNKIQFDQGRIGWTLKANNKRMDRKFIVIYLFSVLLLMNPMVVWGERKSFQPVFYHPLPDVEREVRIQHTDGSVEMLRYKKYQLTGKPFVGLMLASASVLTDSQSSELILLSVVEPKKQKITLINVPSNVMVLDHATGQKVKMSDSFERGPANIINTVEDYFNIPIDYFASIDKEGLIHLVDTYGGIVVHDESGKEVKLNGTQSFKYVFPFIKGAGILQRNIEPIEIIQSLIYQTIRFENMVKVGSILGVLSNHFMSNVRYLDIPTMLSQMNFCKNLAIQQWDLPNKNLRIRWESPIAITNAERQHTTNYILRTLGLN